MRFIRCFVECMIVGFLAAAFVMAIAPREAAGQEVVCTARAEMWKQLADKHRERSFAIGVGNQGQLVEVMVGDGTWSILVHQHDGSVCLVAAGTDWQQLAVEAYVCRFNSNCI